MRKFNPSKVFYEKRVLDYPLGKKLFERYKSQGCEMVEIEGHHNISQLRSEPYSNYGKMKSYLILGTRKTIKLIPNELSADYIVPFTSSGCSAMCLYCYLVCNFFNCTYLRVFVNRDDMIKAVLKNTAKFQKKTVYELGCNSDMLLDNHITGNLRWAIEEFGKLSHAYATFATKFHMVEDLLHAKHNGHTQMRISVNPQLIIDRIELGTSNLLSRIDAANKMYAAGYRIGLNIAPIILIENWKQHYIDMFKLLHEKLDNNLKKDMFIEIIFMTYGYANININKEAFPNAYPFFNKELMKPKGRGKMQYKPEIKLEAEAFLKKLVKNYFPYAEISYVV